MWGICFDINTYPDIYGLVIEYKLFNQDKAFVILPKKSYQLNPKEIKKLPDPPKYIYGQQVSPCNHPEMIGVISEIGWHFKKNCYYYKIRIKEKLALPILWWIAPKSTLFLPLPKCCQKVRHSLSSVPAESKP